jgi:hypothetical protein
MAKPQETRQEQETRWAAQRSARDKAFQAGQQARRTKNRRVVTVVAIVLLVAVIVAIVLL